MRQQSVTELETERTVGYGQVKALSGEKCTKRNAAYKGLGGDLPRKVRREREIRGKGLACIKRR